VLRDKLTVFSPHGGVFLPQRAQRLRRGRKGFASFAEKKHRYAVKKPSIYFVTIP
jgi:hypothetical protein